MHIKTGVAGVAIAMAAATSAASAGDEFSTLDGVSSVPLSSIEMAAVVGNFFVLKITPTSGQFVRPIGVPEASVMGLQTAEDFSPDVVDVACVKC